MWNAIVVRATRRGLAILLLAAVVEPAAPGSAQSATPDEVLGRFTAADAALASYSVPVHVDVYLRKVVGLHFGLNGMQYYKRPGRVALALRGTPARFGRLFSQLGTTLTWSEMYDLRVLESTVAGGRTVAHLEGAPKAGGDVKNLQVAVDSDPAAPVRATWACTDGTTIEMSLTSRTEGPYVLPDRSDVNLSVGRFPIHAVMVYGSYALNAAVPDAAFEAP
jgi:hypothetical protein